MSGIGRTIRGFILWSYERGTVQYDIMVTLILLFLFFSPYWINFNDKPVKNFPSRTDVVVRLAGDGGLLYQIEGAAVRSSAASEEDGAVRGALLRIIEPISGAVSITKYEPVRDRFGRVSTYRVWVQRE
jgi:hypothetical protein